MIHSYCKTCLKQFIKKHYIYLEPVAEGESEYVVGGHLDSLGAGVGPPESLLNCRLHKFKNC